MQMFLLVLLSIVSIAQSADANPVEKVIVLLDSVVASVVQEGVAEE